MKTFFSALLLSLLSPLAFGGVKPDIVFAKPDGVSLTLDAYVPNSGEGPFPACILVHGGGFTKGDKTSFITPLFEPLSKAGFVWFTINYRLAPDHKYPACVEDVEAAVRWVKANAAEYKVDAARLALIGESAGGYLVSYVGVKGPEDTRVTAVVPFYGPHDLVLHCEKRGALGPSMEALFGLKEFDDGARKVLSEASPITYVKPGLPPFLLIHGDKDEKVDYEQSTRFQKKMQEAGNVCDLITVPGGGHGMGGWKKLNSDYAAQMIAWLKVKLH